MRVYELPMRILVVEDHQDIAGIIFDYFEALGHVLDSALDGITGLHLALTNDYDAIVLDVMLPGMSGIELCRRLRIDADRRTPVLILTAKDTLNDKLAGFDCGADDYLVKPFDLLELEARLRSLIRRAKQSGQGGHRLEVGDLRFDVDKLEISRAGQLIQLNPVCRRILLALMRESPRVVSRERLEAAVWGNDPPDSDTLRAHIYLLRLAIDRPFNYSLLKTLRGAGYRLVAHDES